MIQKLSMAILIYAGTRRRDAGTYVGFIDVTSFSWSPDGKFLLFSDFHCDNTCGPRNYIVDIKNWEIVPLQVPHYAGYNLAWSPLTKTALSDGQPNPREDCTNGWSQIKIGGYVNNLAKFPTASVLHPKKETTSSAN